MSETQGGSSTPLKHLAEPRWFLHLCGLVEWSKFIRDNSWKCGGKLSKWDINYIIFGRINEFMNWNRDKHDHNHLLHNTNSIATTETIPQRGTHKHLHHALLPIFTCNSLLTLTAEYRLVNTILFHFHFVLQTLMSFPSKYIFKIYHWSVLFGIIME